MPQLSGTDTAISACLGSLFLGCVCLPALARLLQIHYLSKARTVQKFVLLLLFAIGGLRATIFLSMRHWNGVLFAIKMQQADQMVYYIIDESPGVLIVIVYAQLVGAWTQSVLNDRIREDDGDVHAAIVRRFRRLSTLAIHHNATFSPYCDTDVQSIG